MGLEKVKELKLKCLHMCIDAGTGHVTSAFSCAEILFALYYKKMRIDPKNPDWEDRDRFVMSKNHGSVMLLPILEDLGFIKDKCKTFLQDGSIYGEHTKLEIPGVDFAGGSLGIGIGVSCGMAYSAQCDRKDWKTYCLVGDGECYEGSVWEAAMFAGHHKLRNLVVIIDRNKLCLSAQTEKLLRQESLKEKWEAFNWEVREVDGHNVNNILDALQDVDSRLSDKPLCIIAHTIKGKGVHFMEGNPFFHGVAPKGEKAEQAIKEIEEE